MSPGPKYWGTDMGTEAQDQIIERCKAGDPDAFAELYRVEGPRALHTARLITGSWADAEDSLQEAAVRAWRTIDRFTTGRSFRPWFLKFVVNEALKVRRRRPWSPLSDSEVTPAATGEGPEARAEEQEQHRLVLNALGTLDRNHRAPVVLFYFEGLSEVEVAAILGIRRSTVKSRLHTARRHLAGELERRGIRIS